MTLYKFTRRYGGSTAGDSDQVLLTAQVDLEHTKAAILTMKSDALHRPAKTLAQR